MRAQETFESGGSDADKWQRLRRLYELLARGVNYNISFGSGTESENINGVWANVVTPGVANTDFTVTHNLGRVPVGYIVMKKDIATDIYDGSVAATVTQITLRATVATVTVRLFVL